MSLIHDALRKMEAPGATAGTPAAGVPAAPPHTRQKLGTGALGGALAGVVAGVGIAAIGVAIWQAHVINQPVKAVSAAQPVVALAPAEASVAQIPEVPATPAVDAPPPAVAATRPEADGEAAPQALPAAKDRPRVRHVRAAVPAPVAQPVEPSEAELFHAFEAAIAAHDLPQARASLQTLEARLPASSVTLLRSRAWLAVQSGQPQQAMQDYTQILHRLPGDENASINLAALESQAGHPDKARQILDDLLVYAPDSARATAMLHTLQGDQR